jgi:hypothetical protein
MVVEPHRSHDVTAERDAEYVSALHRVHSNTEANETVPLSPDRRTDARNNAGRP